MNKLDERRKRVVVLCAAVAAMSGVLVLLKGYPILLALWIAFMAVALIYAFVLLYKVKRQSL